MHISGAQQTADLKVSEMSMLGRTRIKFCGFTSASDVGAAVSLGADALGFVFYPKSKRFVTPEQAHLLVQDLPAFVSTVALFVDPEPAFVREVIDAMHPSLLQLHGDESPEFCDALRWPYLKAFRVGAPGTESAAALDRTCQTFVGASAWLYDSYTPAYGGSGHGFDHALLHDVALNPRSKSMVLSGGLTAENVQALISTVKPWAVDVSSGIEASPGVKCAEKMAAFVRAVRRADAD